MTKSRILESGMDAEEQRLIEEVAGKRVLFIATTYLDYLRIQQELRIIKGHANQIDVIVSKNKSYFIRLMSVYFQVLFKPIKRYDVVFLGFAPQLIQCIWWWKFRKKKVIMDFFISFYDTLVHDRKKFKDASLIAKWLLWLDRFTISKADLVIADTAHHADYFCKKMKVERLKLMVLFLEADSKYYFPKKISKDKAYEQDFVVFYFATVLPLQGVDIVIDAIAQMTTSGIHFIFVGPLSKTQKDKLNQQEKLTYHVWLEQSQLSEMIAQADLCLAGHFNGLIEKAKRTIPGKAYIYEAMNKNMLLGENGANRERYPAKYEHVRFVKMGSAKALKEAIICAYEGGNGDDKS